MSFKRPTLKKPRYVEPLCVISAPIISDSFISKICIDIYKRSQEKPLSPYDLNPKLYWDKYQKSITLTGAIRVPEKIENTKPQRVEIPKQPIDYSYIYLLNEKYPNQKAPLIETLKAMSKGGYGEDAMNNVMKNRKWWQENDEELDAEIERRWPTTKTSRKTVKTKILKAVKKN